MQTKKQIEKTKMKNQNENQNMKFEPSQWTDEYLGDGWDEITSYEQLRKDLIYAGHGDIVESMTISGGRVDAMHHDHDVTLGQFVEAEAEPSMMIAVDVYDNSTDWGTIGTYKTERGAEREGRKFARANSSQSGYRGYGPTIRMRYVDANNTPMSDSWEIKAW